MARAAPAFGRRAPLSVRGQACARPPADILSSQICAGRNFCVGAHRPLSGARGAVPRGVDRVSKVLAGRCSCCRGEARGPRGAVLPICGWGSAARGSAGRSRRSPPPPRAARARQDSAEGRAVGRSRWHPQRRRAPRRRRAAPRCAIAPLHRLSARRHALRLFRPAQVESATRHRSRAPRRRSGRPVCRGPRPNDGAALVRRRIARSAGLRRGRAPPFSRKWRALPSRSGPGAAKRPRRTTVHRRPASAPPRPPGAARGRCGRRSRSGRGAR